MNSIHSPWSNFSAPLDMITLNRYDFKQLHLIQPDHAGIINCTNDRDWEALANRVNAAILAEAPLEGKLVRVIRPAK
jgi:hypothetical protein